jgi:hypothetical protein
MFRKAGVILAFFYAAASAAGCKLPAAKVCEAWEML